LNDDTEGRDEGIMLQIASAALVVIDVQERLLPLIHEHEAVCAQIAKLVRGFRICRAPILLTEQYRKGIGPTEPGIIEALGGEILLGEEALPPHPFAPIEKMSFSCAAHPPFLAALRELARPQVVLCGIESHVCVLQTALDLTAEGFEVFLAADAVSSRSPRNVELALRRMEQAGVKLTSVEMAVFEMLHVSGTPQFRAWSKVIR
jgi:nicotinamidase-related amidase